MSGRGISAREISQLLGISRKTLRRVTVNYKREGLAGVFQKNSRNTESEKSKGRFKTQRRIAPRVAQIFQKEPQLLLGRPSTDDILESALGPVDRLQYLACVSRSYGAREAEVSQPDRHLLSAVTHAGHGVKKEHLVLLSEALGSPFAVIRPVG